MTYSPDPIDTSGVELSPRLSELIERLAANNHDHWALQRITEGWRLGPDLSHTRSSLTPRRSTIGDQLSKPLKPSLLSDIESKRIRGSKG
jgi:hypothetical protein